MKIIKIAVDSGQTFADPYHNHTHCHCSIHLEAKVDPGEKIDEAARILQARADTLLAQHVENKLGRQRIEQSAHNQRFVPNFIGEFRR